jgi:hypothetical protein
MATRRAIAYLESQPFYSGTRLTRFEASFSGGRNAFANFSAPIKTAFRQTCIFRIGSSVKSYEV